MLGDENVQGGVIAALGDLELATQGLRETFAMWKEESRKVADNLNEAVDRAGRSLDESFGHLNRVLDNLDSTSKSMGVVLRRVEQGEGMAGMFARDERVIFIDPWLTDNPSCPDALKDPTRCDMILLTHGHMDHVGDVKKLIDRFDPIVVGNFDLCGVLEKQLGKGRYSGMNTGGTQTVEGLRVSLTQALHSSAVDSPSGPLYAGMPNGIVIGVDGLAAVYHAGDTDVFSDMTLIATLLEPKVCILPIGDHFTMGAKDAAMAAGMLKPTAIIPIHYKTFPLLAQSAEAFHDALPADLKERLVVPEVGQSIGWTESGVG